MDRRGRLRAYLAAFGIGAGYFVVSRAFWQVYTALGLIDWWLVESVYPRSPAAYHVAVGLHDLLLNVAIAYPFGRLFLRVGGGCRRRAVAVVVIAILAFEYRFVLAEPEWAATVATSGGSLLGIAMILVPLPVAVGLAAWGRRQ